MQLTLCTALTFVHVNTDGGSNTGGAVLQQYFSERQLAALMPHIDPNKSTGL